MEIRNTLRRALPFAFAAAAVAIISLTAVSPTVIAEDITSRGCSNATLRGDYGIAVSGVRAVGPNATETFVGTGVRTYDGEGGFTQIDNIHGQTTQVSLNQQANGTYEVSANCTGTSRIFPVGTPIVLQTAFVIVAGGDEVRDAVMTPLTNIVTAELRRVR